MCVMHEIMLLYFYLITTDSNLTFILSPICEPYYFGLYYLLGFRHN